MQHKHEHSKYKQTALKIPFQKPEEAFVLKQQEVLPTPLPKHYPKPEEYYSVPIDQYTEYYPKVIEHFVHSELMDPPLVPHPTKSPHSVSVHHYSPAPQTGVPVVKHQVPDTPHLVTIAPSLFVPHHTSNRRYSIEESPATPRRTRPTAYNEMRMVTPSYINPLTTLSPKSYSTADPAPLSHSHSTMTSTPSPPPHSPSPSTTPYIQTLSTPSTSKYTVQPIKNYISQKMGHSIRNHNQPALPPINIHPKPLLVHRAEPSPSTSYHQYPGSYYSESAEEEKEEPMYLVKIVPNPKYKPKAEVQKTIQSHKRIDKDFLQRQSKDPSLYPYLYVLSSYLPQTQHSLVVAKKS